MRDYTKIDAWRLADDLTVAVYECSRVIPKEELYGLTSQLRRAAYSVPANIAEGFGRYGKKDKIKFYRYSYGSAVECLDWNEKAKVRKLLSNEEYDKIFSELKQLPKLIHQLIKFTNEKLKE